jgi:hypothetical protein
VAAGLACPAARQHPPRIADGDARELCRQVLDDASDVGEVHRVVEHDDARLQRQRASPVAADDGFAVAAVDEDEVGLASFGDQGVEDGVRFAQPPVDHLGNARCEALDRRAIPRQTVAERGSPERQVDGRETRRGRRRGVDEGRGHHQRADAGAGADLDDRSRPDQPDQRAEERVLLRRAGMTAAEIERRDLRGVQHGIPRRRRPISSTPAASP